MGKNAIISVFDKTNLDLIAKFLIKKKFTIYSTGGTSEYLKGIDIPHIEISKYTKQKEILELVNGSSTLSVEDIIRYGEEMSVIENKMIALEVAKEN